MIKVLSGSKKPDNRLRRLIDLIGQCKRVIDIGTDHALLPIILAEEDRCDCVVAIDSSVSAFNKAQRNIAKAGVGDKVTVIHGNGLKKIEIKAGDTLVLAGLGGKEIVSILAEKLPLPDNISVIAQAQSDLPLLREFFDSNHWIFLAEEVLESRGHTYIIVKASTGGEIRDMSNNDTAGGDTSVRDTSVSGLSALELVLGPLLLQEWGRRELTEAEKRYLRREYYYRKSIIEPEEVDRNVISYIETLSVKSEPQ
ncbi:MAG: SAM-dependent methyltransferase [Clostridiaceae bacterium]|nr:SAM-dependent methyltransferase [Clostridiaceae bacterium]